MHRSKYSVIALRSAFENVRSLVHEDLKFLINFQFYVKLEILANKHVFLNTTRETRLSIGEKSIFFKSDKIF